MKQDTNPQQQIIPIVDAPVPVPSMISVKATPFVKWAGGKRSIISEIGKRLPKNGRIVLLLNPNGKPVQEVSI